MLLLLYLVPIFSYTVCSIVVFDTKFPIVYEDPQIETAQRSTYFGYSVILYSKYNYAWIQIGAPRANDSRQKIFEPGRIYRCPISDSCKPVYVDTAGEAKTGEYKENKRGSFLGATMALNEESDDIVVCAPKWKNAIKSNLYMVQGSCYINSAVEEDLTIPGHLLLPLVDKEMETYRYKKYNLIAYNYAMGQAGISAHFPKNPDGDIRFINSTTELLLGAPGILNWRGSTVLYKHIPPPNFISKRDLSRGTFGNPNIPWMNNVPGLRSDDYVGFSVSSGFYFSKIKRLYTAAAPRSESYNGKVIVMEYPDETNNYNIIVRQTLNGPTAGGYFGYALASADLTTDGYTDLLVSAPYLREPKVFIYLGNKRGSLVTPVFGAQYLEGGPALGSMSRFGLAITTGDLDLDGNQDVIVGAPEGAKRGAIAVFLGSPNGIKNSLPTQIITAKDFNPGPTIKGFGFSLSSPTDIDKNSYPDIAVGSYLSGHAVILRSRNRAQISLKLQGPNELRRDDKFFFISVCTLWNSKVFPIQNNISIECSISFMGDASRMKFKNRNDGELTFSVFWKTESCQTVTVHLEENIKNYLDPIHIRANISIKESNLENQIILIRNNEIQGKDEFANLNPVLERNQIEDDNTISSQLLIPFSTGCGADNICESDLQINIEYPDLENDEFILGSSESIKMVISVTNIGEPAYITQIKLIIFSPAGIARIPKSCRIDEDYDFDINFPPALLCDLDNPLKENSIKNMTLEIDMRRVINGKITFIAEAISHSKEIDPENNKINSTLTMITEASVVIAGKSVQETYSLTRSDDKLSKQLVIFKHMFEIQKFGASPVDQVLLTLNIPYTYKIKNKYIPFIEVYVPEGYIADQPFYCESVNFEYNTPIVEDLEEAAEEDSTEEYVVKRAKRYASMNTNAESLKLPENRTFISQCEEGMNYCRQIKCFVGPFRGTQSVGRLLLKMAVDIKTFREKIAGLKDILVVRTEGTAIIIKDTLDPPENILPTYVFSVFVDSPPTTKVALWIIIISVILGLLFLLLVIMGLMKAGFFERKIKQELQTLKESEQTAATDEVEWTEDIQKEEEVQMNIEHDAN